MSETIATLKIKHTVEPDAAPPLGLLELGELAVNAYDGKLYIRNATDTIVVIVIENPASLDQDQEFSGTNIFKSVGMNVLTLSDGTISWDGNDGNLATVLLEDDSVLESILNVLPGSYVLRVIQDDIGGHSLSFGTNFKTVDGDPLEISLDADSISIITILNLGDDDFYIMSQNNFLNGFTLE